MSQLRNFEISIWTLQDAFITTIESAWIKTKGKTQNASMTLNIDGTQQLTFSVPMYYFMNGQKISNPAWITFSENKVLLNTRKVKVILNKQTDDEEIYEFVIDKVTERHEHDELFCDVECSGLAFYELGKIGYKVSLSEDDFYNDDYSWFSGETDSDGNLLFEEQPVANIQYWLDKFLKPYSDENFSAAQWYYKIQMNWDLTADFSEFKKDSDKIYENDVYGDTYLLSQEKYRMINLEESNFYNLTQNIAETFGVYCRYVYSYDENYHIIGRTIIFYNNFLDEEKLSINYRGNTQSISRELDTTDLITKMYVKSVDNSGESISIIDVEENESGEDYLLNFDYLYSIGSIDEESYESIEPYKQNLKMINLKLKNVSEQIINIENKLPEVRARLSLAEDSIRLDKEKINSNNKLLMNLTNGTNKIKITNKNPDTAVLIPENNHYYIKITKQGVDFSSLKIYKSFSLSNGSYRLSDEITTGIPIYDEANNLIKINNLYWSANDENNHRSKVIYLIYDYTPSTYYENITKALQVKLNKDEQEKNNAEGELIELEDNLNTALLAQKSLLIEKNNLNTSFEKMMGTAIREGYWQPNDYSECIKNFISSYNISKVSNGSSKYDKFIWDNVLFDGEQNIFYEQGIEKEKIYYPCIKLVLRPDNSLNIGDNTLWNKIHNNLNSLNFIFYDTINTEEYNSMTLRTLSFGSGAQIIFLKKDNLIDPYLLLPGLENYLPQSIENAKINGVIGFIEYNSNGYTISGTDDNGRAISINNDRWVELDNTYEVVYPRIRIESSYLKTDTNSLIIRDNTTTVLTQYIDYYINSRVEESDYLIIQNDNNIEEHPLAISYYITFKPDVIAKTVGLSQHTLEIMFKLSNYGEAIYRDAKEILKDNSKPKVAYNSTIDIFNKNIIQRPSYFLSKIVKINDYDLLLEDAWGYVSGVTLDLDHPEKDTIEIQNYTNKFEDLFTTIVAQTEEMKKTGYIVDTISNTFSSDGTLSANTLQNSLKKVNLNYAFNNGTLTIDEANGIWGTSDSGVVAFRGGGIFTATERDQHNNWIWNTGITPEGINADLITTGQLDTNKIRIFAGDRERFQLNGEGLYAYKSFVSDFDVFNNFNNYEDITNQIDKNNTLDPAQFVRFDENGLFLIAKEGAYILNEDKTRYILITKRWTDAHGIEHQRLDADEELKRISITWDGLTLRNLNGERVFYASADTGDLKMKGSVYANAFYVITEEGNTEISKDIALFINDTSMTELMNKLKNNTDVGARIKDYINAMAVSMGGRYMKTLNNGVQKFTSGSSFPSEANIGDYFQNEVTNKAYLKVSDTGDNEIDWEDLEIYEATGASMVIDNINGSIKLRSTKNITLTAVNSNTDNIESVLNVSINGITLASNKTITLNSQSKINILSQGAIEIASGGNFSAIGSDFYIASINKEAYNNTSAEEKKSLAYLHGYFINNKYHLDIGSDNLRITSNGSLTIESGGVINVQAGGTISLMSGGNSAIELSQTGISMATDKTLKINTSNFKLRPDLVFNQTSSNNPYFYIGDREVNSGYLRYSNLNGLEMKATKISFISKNLIINPDATDDEELFRIGSGTDDSQDDSQDDLIEEPLEETSYYKDSLTYLANGTLTYDGNIIIGGNDKKNSSITIINADGYQEGIWNRDGIKIYQKRIDGNISLSGTPFLSINYEGIRIGYDDVSVEGAPERYYIGRIWYNEDIRTLRIRADDCNLRISYTTPDESNSSVETSYISMNNNIRIHAGETITLDSTYLNVKVGNNETRQAKSTTVVIADTKSLVFANGILVNYTYK